MNEYQDAASNLQVIRLLLERSTVYRAISVPAAVLGGVLAVPAAWLASHGGECRFLIVWFAALAIVSSFNIFQLWSQAHKESRPFFSNGFRLALRALAPPLLAGGIIGGQLAWQGIEEYAAATWILSYGLALLASREFAPRSIVILGTVFFVFGLIAFQLLFSGIQIETDLFTGANILMASTFGLLHLGYAIAVSMTIHRAP